MRKYLKAPSRRLQVGAGVVVRLKEQAAILMPSSSGIDRAEGEMGDFAAWIDQTESGACHVYPCSLSWLLEPARRCCSSSFSFAGSDLKSCRNTDQHDNFMRGEGVPWLPKCFLCRGWKEMKQTENVLFNLQLISCQFVCTNCPTTFRFMYNCFSVCSRIYSTFLYSV